VLLLDDLHWADSASLELAAALLRHPPAAPVLTAFAVRPRQVPSSFVAAIERAAREGALTRVELGGLTLEEARELLSGTPDRDAAALYEQTGGNPFYLEQLARHGGEGGRPASADELGAPGIPSAVAASLGEELTLLSPTARLVLDGAAVAGDPFEFELAAVAAAVSEDVALDAVDEFIGLDLVRSTDVPRRFRFRHPLVRGVVYESSAAGWRLGAHERCAVALAARGAAATARAQHVARSAAEGDLEAVALLRQAGSEAARLAPASAAHWFAQALRLLPQSSMSERVELLRARADALTATGHFTDSHEALLEALDLVRDGSDEQFARLSRDCAAVESLLGRPQQAADRLRNALARLPAAPSLNRVDLLLELAVNSLFQARFDELRASANAALADAQALADAPHIAAALAVASFAESLTGDADAADANRAQAAEVVDRLTDDELARYLEGAAWLAGVELYLDRYVDADGHASRALSLARTTGHSELFLILVQILGGVWRQRGKLTQGAELLDGGIEAARLLHNTHALVWSLSGRSTVALPLGDVELALATAEEAFALSRGVEATFHAAEAAAVLAAAKLELGEPEAAIELLLHNAGGEQLELITGSPRALYLELLTRSRLAVDRLDDAARSAEHAAAWAQSVRLPMAAAWAARARAAVSLRRGDGALAAAEALSSAAAAEAAGAPVDAALARMLAGRAFVQAGDRNHAVTELRGAAAQLDAHGCVRLRGEADRELGRLGQRAHRRTAAGKVDGSRIESLTGRELEIAQLVVDRKTNSEIASELFLSPKTVESHLRNVFRKVGVASRVELARAVEVAAGDRASP